MTDRTNPSHAPRLTDDDRFELLAHADAAERRSRPRALLVLAGLLLAASLGAIGLAALHRGSIDQRIANARYSLEQTQGALQRLRDARDRVRSSADAAQPPDPQILSRIQGFAREAGLVVQADTLFATLNESDVRLANGPRLDDIKRRRWTYRVNDPSIANLLDWARRTLEGFPGMYVYDLNIKPAGANWQFIITFARTEQTR